MRMILGLASVVREGFRTLIEERRWKLIPAFAIFLALSALLVLVKAVSPIAPFVYSLF